MSIRLTNSFAVHFARTSTRGTRFWRLVFIIVISRITAAIFIFAFAFFWGYKILSFTAAMFGRVSYRQGKTVAIFDNANKGI
ncbi:hypothetical protein CK621_03250 [Vandammella animalimorsus]|uniref:Uncharacterized protein n=1 Tax=Vandammella animalimorsus TaxID=2029117 RepID=A0A2A2B0P3_9BURK|nr:hypothetical protein CK621_03250 [Vandammella animalimorsus]